MYRKCIIVIALFFITVIFAHDSFSQAANQVIHKDVITVKLRTPMQFDTGRNFVDNTSKSKKVKTKIRIVHGSSCPSFMNYTSKTRDKRVKMLNKKRK